MEQRISDFIKSKIDRGNVQAFTILVNIAVDMVKRGEPEEAVYKEIERLLKWRTEV